LVEFTGERVIPGQVEPDLWNEHVARYLFAASLAKGRRVLDAGCGSGYGSAGMARAARSVIGFDLSAPALCFARTNYRAPNLSFLLASCAALPLAAGSVDLAVAFEVIEHIPEWREFLGEFARVLAPDGVALISTPNKHYYTGSRGASGPNPYHVHEFEFEEFEAALRGHFPEVSFLAQNHVAGIGFEPLSGDAPALRAVRGESRGAASDANFFIAVCARRPQPPASGFLYVPSTANVLRERELHIERLEADVERLDGEVAGLQSDRQQLVDMYREQKAELEKSNAWAGELEEKLQAAQARIVALQEELAATVAGYQAQVEELDRANREKTEWAARVQQELEAKGRELLHAIELLDAAEKTVEERTAWALRLQGELEGAQTQLAFVRASRWLQLGRKIGLGPELPEK
jgi:SAM-dependent methyltransferase